MDGKQGHRQEFATGDKRGGLGTEVPFRPPSGFQEQNRSGGLGAKPPEARDFSPRRGLVILIPVQFHLVLQFSSIIIVYTVIACIYRSLRTYI